MAPLVPPSFVDSCFNRQTKPLLPMVPPLLLRPPSLVSCFRCPSPSTLAASHADVISSLLPSQPALRRHHRLRSVLPLSLRCHQRSFPSAESSEFSRRDSRLSPAILHFSGEGKRAITVVAAAAAVGDYANVHLCIIVVIVLIVTAIPPPHRSQGRAARLSSA